MKTDNTLFPPLLMRTKAQSTRY